MPDPTPPPPTPLKRFALQRPKLAPPGTVRIDQAPAPPPPFSPWQLWGQGLLEAVVDPVRGAFAGASGPEDTLAAKSGELVAALPALGPLAAAGRGLYSRVDEALKLLPKKGAHPNKVLSLLKNNASVEELTYRGVPEFLAAKGNATVTPADLAAHLAVHPAPVPTVVTKGAEGLVGKDLKEWFGARGIPQSPQEWTAASDDLIRLAQQWQRNGDRAQADRFFRLSEQATELAEGLDLGRGLGAEAPKYAQYQLPGGEGYRETLLTLPDTTAARLDARRREIEALGREATPAQKQEWADIMNQLKPETRDVEGLSQYRGRPEFRSGHFEEPNILVHTRANTRTLPTGERGRFVEEVQSDWHQQGKQEGYAGPPTPVETSQWTATPTDSGWAINDETGQLVGRVLRGDPGGGGARTADEAIAKIARWKAGNVASRAVPDAPFKETWPDLGLKQQVLETAADPNAEWIGFTSGQTQAARYDLSKQISRLEYAMIGKDRNRLTAFDLNGQRVIDEVVAPDKLPDYIGKEAAEKLLASEFIADPHAAEGRVPRPTQAIEGVDLQVGGEGMRHFYDQVLPKRLEKIVKPFGGTVERGTISGDPTAPADVVARYANQPNHPFTQKQNVPMWFARLSPEMKARILKEGLPLLSLTAFLAQMGQPSKETR